MQRHISDSFALPLRTHGIPSSRKQDIFQRGTVSMPTSPILRAGTTWDAGPHTAKGDMFSLDLDLDLGHPENDQQAGADAVEDASASAYHNQTYPTSLFPPHRNHALPLHPPPPINGTYRPRTHYLDDGPFPIPSEDLGRVSEVARNFGVGGEFGDRGGEGGPPRKKRAQVRIACTHCQKACKKCSNTRPCERCVRYGLPDCVDSSRKPRKTGIKRGPYKRRSSKYTLSDASLDSPLPPLGAGGMDEHGAEQWWQDRPDLLNTHHLPPHLHQGQFQQAQAPPLAHATAHIPPPRSATSALQRAFSAAFGPLHGHNGLGPRWVNGQRVSDPPASSLPFATPLPQSEAATANADLPDPSALAFPLSLHHFSDPFSRAVSPIRQLTPTAWQPSTSAPASAAGVSVDDNHHPSFVSMELGNRDSDDIDMATLSASLSASAAASASGTTTPAPTAPAFPWSQPTLPWDAQVLSAPTSPRTSSAWPLGLTLAPRASSAEPPDASASHIGLGPQWTRFHNTLHSPALIALKKIRKPSLKTLMSPLSSAGQSRAGSPTFSPAHGMATVNGFTGIPMRGTGMGGVRGMGDIAEASGEVEQSPTLFDQPMALDDVPELAWDDPSVTGAHHGDMESREP